MNAPALVQAQLCAVVTVFTIFNCLPHSSSSKPSLLLLLLFLLLRRAPIPRGEDDDNDDAQVRLSMSPLYFRFLLLVLMSRPSVYNAQSSILFLIFREGSKTYFIEWSEEVGFERFRTQNKRKKKFLVPLKKGRRGRELTTF